MPKNGLTYEALWLEVKKRLLGYVISKGYGGPLLFILIFGAGILFTVFHMTFGALLWVAVVMAIGFFMTRQYLKSPRVLRKLIRAIVEQRFPVGEISDYSLKETAVKSLEIFCEIIFKTLEILRAQGSDQNLSRALGDADEMLTLQIESAIRVEKLRSALAIIGSGRKPSPRTKNKSGQEENSRNLLEENIAAIEKEISEEQALVAEVGQKLQTLMAQVSLMDKRTSEQVRTVKLAEETSQSLKNLQAVVNARRELADEIIGRLDRERS